MRVVHVYKDYHPVHGGIENHIRLLAETQAARGHDIAVVVTSRDRHSHTETIAGVRVIYAGRLATIASTPISFDLVRQLRQERADIVHLHFPYPWGELAQRLSSHSGALVLTYHSDIVRQRLLGAAYAPLLQRLLDRVDTIIATSPNYVASSDVLRQWRQKCVVIPLGIDPSRFAPIDDHSAQALRSRLFGDTRPRHVALFAGVLRYYKGVQHLLEAAVELPELHLVIAGSGPLEAQLKDHASKLGIEARVRFAGRVDDSDLPAYYAASDVVVLPSTLRSEAFGTVQLEAMAAGKPVVCTELGTGTSFVNLDGTTGRVVRAGDTTALVEALRTLIDDPDLPQRMGDAGRARVRQHFTADRMTDEVLSVYQRALRIRQ